LYFSSSTFSHYSLDVLSPDTTAAIWLNQEYFFATIKAIIFLFLHLFLILCQYIS